MGRAGYQLVKGVGKRLSWLSWPGPLSFLWLFPQLYSPLSQGTNILLVLTAAHEITHTHTHIHRDTQTPRHMHPTCLAAPSQSRLPKICPVFGSHLKFRRLTHPDFTLSAQPAPGKEIHIMGHCPGGDPMQSVLLPFFTPCGYFFVCSFVLFLLFRATPVAYGSFQDEETTAASLHHSHGSTISELHLQPTPQLMAVPDPWPTEGGQGSNPHPQGY